MQYPQETPVLESLFDKVAGQKVAASGSPTAVQ